MPPLSPSASPLSPSASSPWTFITIIITIELVTIAAITMDFHHNHHHHCHHHTIVTISITISIITMDLGPATIIIISPASAAEAPWQPAGPSSGSRRSASRCLARRCSSGSGGGSSSRRRCARCMLCCMLCLAHAMPLHYLSSCLLMSPYYDAWRAEYDANYDAWCAECCIPLGATNQKRGYKL